MSMHSNTSMEPSPQARSGERRRVTTRRLGYPGWFTYVVLAAAVVLSVFPFYWMFVVASNDNSVVAAVPPVLVPGPNFADRINTILSQFPFDRAYLNSFIVAAGVAVSTVFFCPLAGFAFAKMEFRGRNVLFALTIGTMMIPSQLSVVPLFMVMSRLGWIDSLQALIAPSMVTAFGVFWMRQYISGAVHDEILAAARVDGATSFQTYRTIVFPMIRPGAAVLGLFAFMDAWNDFLWPQVVLNSPSNFTVQVALRQIERQAHAVDYGVALAGSLLATLPLLLLFLLLGRQIVAGIMEGAVRG
jgi:cellobiose transport system permease protein